jgi:hypothetical protein
MTIFAWCLRLIPLFGGMAGLVALPAQEETMFPDVPKDHWAYEAVANLKRQGILVGYPPEPEPKAAVPKSESAQGKAARPARRPVPKKTRTGRQPR